jgi:hypothetical protein
VSCAMTTSIFLFTALAVLLIYFLWLQNLGKIMHCSGTLLNELQSPSQWNHHPHLHVL